MLTQSHEVSKRDSAVADGTVSVSSCLGASPLSRREFLWNSGGGLGGVALASMLGGDGVLGHRGTVDLAPGQTRTHFDEVGLDGRSLGLRPFDFSVGLEGHAPGGGVALVWSDSSDSTVLTPARASASSWPAPTVRARRHCCGALPR